VGRKEISSKEGRDRRSEGQGDKRETEKKRDLKFE
jgi:hypothetical protein